MHKTVCIGYDTPSAEAFAVARFSLGRRSREEIPLVGLELAGLQARGIYTRAVERRFFADGSSELWDSISEQTLPTECTVARFLTPFIAKWRGWAVFVPASCLAFTDIGNLFKLLDSRCAVMCVPVNRTVNWRVATKPERYGWSDVMAFNCEHQANSRLTLQLINAATIQDLNRFCWLEDSQIGALPPEWHWIEGTTDPNISPALVNFAEAKPWLSGTLQFSKEWRRDRSLWIAGDEAAL